MSIDTLIIFTVRNYQFEKQLAWFIVRNSQIAKINWSIQLRFSPSMHVSIEEQKI